jgi:transcriptional regulator with XRE-family HTH domain
MDIFSVFQKYAGMDELEWIRRGLEKPGKTQTGLARAMGVSPSAVTQLLKGRRELKYREIRPVAQYLDVTPPGMPEAAPEDPPLDDHSRTVPVVGYVGAGAATHYYAVSQGELDRVPAPEGDKGKTVVVEIRGDSLGKAFNQWLVFYDEVHRPVDRDLHGKLCVVGLADDRILVKKLHVKGGGLFDLISNTEDEEPIRNVAVEWAAKVKRLEPRS